MASFFREGSKFSFNGIKGDIIRITETYRKNVLVVKITHLPKEVPFDSHGVTTLGFFEYPDGKIEFMSVIN